MTHPIRKSIPVITAVLGLSLIVILVLVQVGTERPKTRKLFSYGERTFSARWSFSFSADDRYYALIADETNVEVRTLPHNVLIQTFTYPEDNPPGTLAFAPNSQQIAIGTKQEVDIWDLDNNQLPMGHLVDEEVAQSWGTVIFSSDNSQLVHHGAEILRIWDIASGQLVVRESLPGYQLAMNMAFAPDGNTLVINNGFIYILDLEKEEIVARIRETAQSIAISADGRRLVSISNSKVFQWRLADGSLINNFDTGNGSINVPLQPEVAEVLSFSAERTGDRDNPFRFFIAPWNIDEAAMRSQTETFDYEIDDMTYFVASPSGKWLAWLSFSGEVDIWQIER